jgi:hypothetical protein
MYFLNILLRLVQKESLEQIRRTKQQTPVTLKKAPGIYFNSSITEDRHPDWRLFRELTKEALCGLPVGWHPTQWR